MPNYSGVPSDEDELRAAKRQLRDFNRRMAKKRGEKAPPEAADEQFPGKGSFDTDDLRLARRGRKRPSREPYA